MKARHIKYFVLLIFIPLLLIPVGLSWLSGHLHQPLVMDEEYILEVPRGGSLHGVMRQLERDGLLGEGRDVQLRRWSVRLYSLTSDEVSRIHIGEYRLRPGDNLASVLDKLENGDVIQWPFVIIEGSTFRDMRAQLGMAPGVEGLTLQMSDADIMAELGKPDVHPEGWFAPDTYFYTRGTTDLALMRRALMRQERLLESAWADRDDVLPYDTAYEALVMASIIERETGVPYERGKIAGVFVRRLEERMRLQTDPTVIYGMGERYDGRIRSADLREATPYNTYVIRGLPPTPIAMPGAAAIRAAVQPERTEALFFVARGDGSHHFSATLQEHNAAVRRYQLNRREDYRSSPPPASSSP